MKDNFLSNTRILLLFLSMNKHLASKINLLNLLVSPLTRSLVIGYPNTYTNYIEDGRRDLKLI